LEKIHDFELNEVTAIDSEASQGLPWRSLWPKPKMKINKLILMSLSGAALLALSPLVHADCPAGPGGFHHRGNMTEMLTHVLNLTDSQKAQIQPLADALKPQIEAIHKKAQAEMKPIMKQFHDQIRPLLTAEQQKKLDALETLHDSD